jgi:hypothetical protein
MKTIKLTDKQLDIMKTALHDYVYHWEQSLEGSKDSSFKNENLDKQMEQWAIDVARNIKSAKNILEKLTN